jgi:DNA-binding winged helix-turn-helix (wHTH) protein/tetratricopeptide (TPR) repeat protein
MVLVFGECELDLDRVELRYGGRPRPVEPQVFEVLAYLVRHRDRMVSKEELLDQVWHSRFVTESAVSSRIKSARRAIGDDGRTQGMIRTVHGRGYQFVGDVRSAEPVTAPRPAPVQAAGPVPAQLPLAVRVFTGREQELARLEAVLAGTGDGGSAGPAAVIISALSGTAGVGKTALAVHWAHRIAHRYPDGQLYVNLRGFDPSGAVLDPAEAIRGFLAAFRVPAERIPSGLAEQAALYRSVLAGKRALVVLDNARDAEQVRPLLPGSPGCLALVTSRMRLTPLVAVEGAHPVALDLLTEQEARDLLGRRLGADRVDSEPEAVDELIHRCARLPLALAITAARVVTNPDRPLAALAAELSDAGAALNALDGGDASTDVRAVLSWSYRALSPTAARLLRLLALPSGPDVGAAAAAILLGVDRGEAQRLVGELTGAHLLTEHMPGRYVFHDLLRAYAAELAQATDSAAERRAALRRLLDHHLQTGHRAALLLHPQFSRIRLPPADPAVTPEPLADGRQAAAWFAAELPCLLASVRDAARAGEATHAWQLNWVLAGYLERHGHWPDLCAAASAALDATSAAGDRTGQAHAHRDLARVCSRLGRHDQALDHVTAALTLFEQVGDEAGRAHTYLTFGQLLERRGRRAEALEHSLRALQLFRIARHPPGEAYTLNAVGWQHALLGDFRRALEYCGQGLRQLQRVGDRSGEADTWDSLGFAHHGLGDYPRAIECYRRALELFEANTDRYSEGSALDRLGDSHQAAGDLTAARDAWQRALTVLDALGHPDAESPRAKLRSFSHQPV